MLSYWFLIYLLLILYSLTILWFTFGWIKQKSFIVQNHQNTDDVSVSVVIAIRNEKNNIDALIQSLLNQNAHNGSLEAILIDDHSTDSSYHALNEYALKHEWIKVFQLKEGKKGKKAALQLGISKAVGELLVFTDGDCTHGENWIHTLTNFYVSHEKPEMIIGLVDMIATNWKEKLFRLEFLSLIISSAGSAFLGHPFICSGANLAVRASAITDFSPNYETASGDDVFLLHHIKKKNGHIMALKTPLHLVNTKAPKNFYSFLNQRKRWASKAKHYTDIAAIVVTLIVFLTNFMLITSLFIGAIWSAYFPLLILFAFKTLIDAILFLSAKNFYKLDRIIQYLPIISLVYPFYISYIALISIKKPFAWKGRKIFS